MAINRGKTQILQWRDTSAVIDWLFSRKVTQNCKFMKFDVEEYYIPISQNILLESIK